MLPCLSRVFKVATRHRAVLFLPAFFVISGVIFADVLFAGRAFFELDPVGVGYPVHYYAAQAVKAGHFPFWAPYYAYGFPFYLESQAGVLYPFHALMYGAPLSQFFFWYHAVLAIHYALAGWFAFLWVKDLTESEGAGFFAGITLMMGGYMMGHQIHLNIIEVVTWCPLILYLMGKTGGRWKGTVGIGIAFALQAFAGHIPTLILFLPGAFAYAVWLFVKKRLQRETWKNAAGPLMLLAVGGIIGILLSLPQTLPQALYIPLSQRGIGEYLQPGIPMNQFVHLFVPFPQGARWFETGLFHGFLGWFLPLLALTSARREIRYEIAALWSLVFLFFYLALGSDSQAFLVLHNVPPFSLTRYPGRYSLEVGLFLAAAAGVSYSAIVARWGRAIRWLPGILIGAQIANLASVHSRVAPRTDAEWLLKTPPYHFQIPRDRVPYRVYPTGLDQYAFQEPEGMLADAPGETYPSELVSQSLALYHRIIYAPAQSWLFVPAPSVPMMNGLARRPDPSLYSAFGIRYLIIPTTGNRSKHARLQMKQWGFDRIIATSVADVYENPGARPMAYLANRFRVVPDPWAVRKRYTDTRLVATEIHPDYNAAIKTLIVEAHRDPALVLLDRDPGIEPSPADSEAEGEIMEFLATPRGFVVRGNADSDLLLVVLDQCLPGWRVAVNGIRADLFRANYFFKATVVPKGNFEAVFTYGLLPVGNCEWTGKPRG
jgi:hypothetical protein